MEKKIEITVPEDVMKRLEAIAALMVRTWLRSLRRSFPCT